MIWQQRRIGLCLFAIVGVGMAGLVPTPVGSLSMGGAGVASTEGCEALLVNPAALGLMDADVGMREGEKRQDFHLDASTTLLVRGLPLYSRLGMKHQKIVGLTNIDSLLAKDPNLPDVLWDLNRQTFSARPELQLSMASGNLAFTGWMLGDVGLLFKHQALFPGTDVTDTISVGVQVGMSQPLIPNELWAGVAVKLMLAEVGNYSSEVSLVQEEQSSMNQIVSDQVHLKGMEWVGGADVGLLWLPTLEWRLGTSLRDLGMHFSGDVLMPQWDIGASWLPASEQSDGMWKQRLALSFGLVNLLDARNDWKPLSKIAFGGQFQESPLPWGLFSIRLSGGFLGGYPTAGIGLDLLRVTHLDFSTWARESGWYTGQLPDRVWSLRGSIGW
jgi:hypothetical protein